MIEFHSGCYDTHSLKEMRSHDFDQHYQEYAQEFHL